jgi:hypothetical protein
MPQRQQTFDPCRLTASDDLISVDCDSQRVLLAGLSFDYVELNDGYIEPSSQKKLDYLCVPCRDDGSLLCHGEGKVPAVDVLPNEQTVASSHHDCSSPETAFSTGDHSVNTKSLNVERHLKKVVRLLRKSLKT